MLDVVNEHAETPDRLAISVGQERETNPVFLGKTVKSFLRIVPCSSDRDTLVRKQRARLFQLDELGTAVLSPIGASVENEQQAVRAREIHQ